MAVTGISQAVSTISVNNTQAQGGGAQGNLLAGLQQKTASVQTQLSVQGRVRYSLAELQAKAQALLNFSKSPTLEDFKTVIQGFVQSYNNLSRAVAEASAPKPEAASQKPETASQKPGTTSSDSSLGQTLKDVQNAVSGPDNSSRTALQKLGMQTQSDGSLSANLQTLGQALQNNPTETLNTLAGVADRVSTVIDKQLSTNGHNGSKVQDLSAQGKESETSRNSTQVRLDTQKNFQQRLAAQLVGAGGYTARNAVVAYFSVSSL